MPQERPGLDELRDANTQALQIEQHRAMLRQAFQRYPDNAAVQDALRRFLTPEHIREAAERGVFVSYSRSDELFALALDEGLREVGVNVWLDQIDVDPSKDWAAEVRRALNQCGVMLAILSPDAMADADLQHERQQFLNAGKIVIPVLHQRCDTSALRTLMQPIDFRHDFQRGLLQLRRLFATTATA